ncbi:hypothetical protein K432DRAFT_395346 [Lepidopterella palustris CBS 459.81]|uniref:RBR-type E3 ubiquitin transferase n=1 Tax=Lepidopterella palustris CBS 459.81 TaxID=1314670 RepID=A0A8E2E5U6_9PEZI|nr:hypothetical protein K432DRAFT_395346 [Lepidopterella palustris CBS 459.81]
MARPPWMGYSSYVNSSPLPTHSQRPPTPPPSYSPPPYSQPDYPQPAYAQPAYTQPVYAQPAYSQTAYAQPAYAQPAYTQPAYESTHELTYEIEGPPFTCGICLDEKVRSESYIFDCISSHTFCLDCSRESVQGSLDGNSIPKCPGERCKHEISQQEIKQLVPTLLDKYNNLLLKRLFAQGTFLVCKCKHVMAAAYDGQQERCECPKCNYVFCSLCNEDYHYRSTCQELKQYRNIWTEWLRQGRRAYHQATQQKQQQYEKQTKEYMAAQKKHEEDRAAALLAFQTLQKDEQYKAQRARRCPNCNRVVERIEGCDAMTCGQDKYGGNVQSGCGREFRWANARPYAAETANMPNIEQFVAQAPQQAADFRHEFTRCDHCGVNDIVGLRFECLNCPSFDLCSKCEHNGIGHDQRHVFRIWRNNTDNGLQRR